MEPQLDKLIQQEIENKIIDMRVIIAGKEYGFTAPERTIDRAMILIGLIVTMICLY